MRKKTIILMFFGFLVGVCFFVSAQIASAEVISSGGLVPCGKSGQPMCTLCDLIKGFYNIIHYIMGISVIVVLAMFTLGGSSYVTSFGDPKAIEGAKGMMKNACIGLAIILLAWIFVNTVMFFLGAKQNLGIGGVSNWWEFQCVGAPR
ncbi:MAG: pilin [Candidatus Moraniibacteriota bacterium]